MTIATKVCSLCLPYCDPHHHVADSYTPHILSTLLTLTEGVGTVHQPFLNLTSLFIVCLHGLATVRSMGKHLFYPNRIIKKCSRHHWWPSHPQAWRHKFFYLFMKFFFLNIFFNPLHIWGLPMIFFNSSDISSRIVSRTKSAIHRLIYNVFTP